MAIYLVCEQLDLQEPPTILERCDTLIKATDAAIRHLKRQLREGVKDPEIDIWQESPWPDDEDPFEAFRGSFYLFPGGER